MKNIPKKIHLIWFGNKEPNIPYLNKIKEIYNDHEVKVWREEDFDMNNLNAFVKFAYEQKRWAFVSDYFRMKILYDEGGIYLDTDMEPIKKFSMDSDADIFAGYEYRNNLTMGFIACAKGHKFPKSVMEYYESIILPGFFPLGNLVWTEIMYSLYPKLGVANKTKRCEDLQMMNRNTFGLWRQNKKDVYFVHRHSIDWIDSSFQKWLIHFSARFAKLTPAFVENIMVIHQRRMTAKKTKLNIDYKKNIKLILIDFDVKFLTKELFEEILNSHSKVIIHLEYKNKLLKNTLLKIYNVKKVKFGHKKTNLKEKNVDFIEIGNSQIIKMKKNRLVFKFKTSKNRSNIETMTNIYSRIFKSEYDEILLK